MCVLVYVWCRSCDVPEPPPAAAAAAAAGAGGTPPLHAAARLGMWPGQTAPVSQIPTGTVTDRQ